MTDITEPTRIREQLSASYERFTTVLEALDAAVSVAPHRQQRSCCSPTSSYRLWFGSDTVGHLGMVCAGGRALLRTRTTKDWTTSTPMPACPIDRSSRRRKPTQQRDLRRRDLGKWLEVRSRYLTWVDGQARAAGDCHRHHAAPRCRGASRPRRPIKAQAASRLITMGEMASSVAHELNQPLTAITNYCNGMMSRIKGQTDRHRGAARGAREDLEAGAARGPDHPAHPLLREAQRAEPHTGRRGHHGERSGRARGHRAAPAQRAPEPLRGRAAAGGARRPDPDRAGDGQPAEERGRIHRPRRTGRSRAAASSCACCPKTIEGHNAVEFSVQDTGKGLVARSDGPAVRSLLLHQARRHGNRAESYAAPSWSRTAAGCRRRTSTMARMSIGCRFSFWITGVGRYQIP
jgi:hypothetical protein